MQFPQLDKYARDARAWRDAASVNYAASTHLFDSGNPALYGHASTLAHHALEMFLKSSLICEGMTIFNPILLQSLAPGFRLTRADCAWGHGLAQLAKHLAQRRTDFRLKAEVNIGNCHDLLMPMTLEAGFALFDAFHSDLCVPREVKPKSGSDHKLLLEVLVLRLRPFLSNVRTL